MFSSTNRSLCISALLVLGLGLTQAGCGAKDDDDIDAADGVESSACTAQVSSFNQMVFSPVTSQEPEEAAGATSDQSWNAGCATRTKDTTNPAVAHIHLEDCTGPFGLRKHSGDITVVFSKNSDGTLHAQATSSNMTVNGKPVSWSGTADATISGAQRQVKYQGAWTRENGRGETVSHSSDLSISIDTATKCRVTNGTSQTLVGDRKVDSTIKDYKVCRDAEGDGCPTGTIVHNHAQSDKSVTIQFDGTAEAQVTGPKGNTVGVPLVCTP